MGLRTWLDVVDDVMLQRWHTRHLPSDPKDVCGPDVEGKTFIVTGPTSGIGTTTAETLARLGARVILACRTVKRGEALVERWARDSEPGAPPLDCEVMHLDLDSLRSVRAFAEAFLATDRPLHCLVNNAGVFDMSGAYRKTQDGHEQHYGTNYLAPALLSLMLMPALRRAGDADAAAPARVIFVCSKLHEFCDGLALDDLAFERRRYGARAAYAQSKLAELLFARALERRLRGRAREGHAAEGDGDANPTRKKNTTNARCLVVHPGNIVTGVVRTLPRFVQAAYRIIMGSILLTPRKARARRCSRRQTLRLCGETRWRRTSPASASGERRRRAPRTTTPPRRCGRTRSRRSGWRRSRRDEATTVLIRRVV
jgi:NAD(P)-dependent dehydrogenase (short-subunit alcohol dehydrogenase family)